MCSCLACQNGQSQLQGEVCCNFTDDSIADLVKRFQEEVDDHISEASESEPESRPRIRRGRTEQNLRRADDSYAKNASRLNSPSLNRERPSLLRTSSNPIGKGKAPVRRKPAPGRVSSIARHFDRLSREAERDRQKRISLARGKRARPVGVTKAKVQVFNNVRDAYKDEFDTDSSEADNEEEDGEESDDSAKPKVSLSERLEIELPPFDTSVPLTSIPAPLPSATPPSESEMSSGPERSSILKTLSGLWAFRTGEFAPLDYPLSAAEHVFADSRIIIREDEPTSIIAFTLSSKTHRDKLRNVAHQRKKDDFEEVERAWDVVLFDEAVEAEESMRREGTHLKYGGSMSF